MEINQAKIGLYGLILIFPMLTSCTVNVTLAHTEGYANDLVDETASTDPEVDTQIPLSGI